MEVKFEQNTLSCLDCIASGVQRAEQTQELRLPEGYPDIGRILGCWGQVLLRGKQWRSSGMSVNAGVMAWVLYAPEDGSEIRVVDAWIPLSCKWEFPKSVDDGIMTIQPLLAALDARSTSARKIMVRAEAQMMGQGSAPRKIMVAVPPTLPEDVHLRREHYPVELPVEGGEKQVTLEQRFPLPEQQASGKILSAALLPQVLEQKMAGSRLIIRGEAILDLRLILEDGNLDSFHGAIPFSQYAELDRDYEGQASVHLEPVVTALELNREENGDLSVKAGIAIQYVVYERRILETVTDAYSPCREVTAQNAPLELPIRLDLCTVEVPVQGNMEPQETEDISPISEFPSLSLGESGTQIQMQGHFQCLSRNDEGHLATETVRFSGEVPFSSAEGNRVALWVSPGAAPEVQNGTIRCCYPVTATVTSGAPIPMVVGLELGEEKPLDPARPSLILRRAGEEDLWTIAKDCGSTVEAICKANQLQQEPEKGQMLLIPVC